MPSLADAIINEDVTSIRQLLRFGANVNEIDEYGFRAIIEAAIADNLEISTLLLENGAIPNLQDATGGTALQWAVENNNLSLVKLLLDHGANPNSYNFSGQPVLVMPLLRQQTELSRMLLNAGADLVFAQDFINVKLIGHLYELMGTTNIISPDNQFVEVDFEGYFLEVTIGLIADSLAQFQNHFAARQLRRYAGLTNLTIEIMQRASRLVKLQQYRVDKKKYAKEINAIIAKEPLIIPVGYEGHAITFIKAGNIWVKCDRREDSRLYDNVMFYEIQKPEQANSKLIKSVIYDKQSSEFINEELDKILDLRPITELKIPAQISGNCSWANVEATIPAIFLLMLMQHNHSNEAVNYYKTLSLNYFNRWREWNKDRVLSFCIQRYNESDSIRKACHAEILAAILFQRCTSEDVNDQARVDMILNLLINSPYEYILRNYLRVYYYESATEEGKHFFDLLKQHDFKV